MIIVEVRRRILYKKFNTIPMDSLDLRKYINFQNKFNIPIWYFVSNEELFYNTWFWIPMQKITELESDMFSSSKSKQDFIPIKIEQKDSLGKIFSDI